MVVYMFFWYKGILVVDILYFGFFNEKYLWDSFF